MSSLKNDNFATLFKKYRLRSEIETLSQFGDLLAQEGLTYENSLFTHWQKGDRVPRDRKVLLTIVTVFIKKRGINTTFDVNELLKSANARDIEPEEEELVQNLIISHGGKKIVKNKLGRFEKLEKVQVSYLDMLSRHMPITILSGFYLAICVWWISLYYFHLEHSSSNIAFGFAFGLVPVFGGLMGVISSRRLSYTKKTLRKAVFFYSLGILSWGIGQMIWSIYNFVFKIEIPYPVLSDLGFLSSWPLWGMGMYFLAKSTRSLSVSKAIDTSKKQVAIITLVTIAVTYYLLIIVGKGGVLTSSHNLLVVFFDLAYPLMDILLVIEALLLYGSFFRYVKGRYKLPVYIILGAIVLNFIGDVGFSYTTRVKTYFNGSWVDFIFAITLYLMSISINSFKAMEDYARLEVKDKHETYKAKYYLPYASLIAVIFFGIGIWKQITLTFFKNILRS